MPLIDMPLDELKTYGGQQPLPRRTIDAVLETALAEMRAVEPRVELVPHRVSAPYAECFDLFFTGVRGARIHAKYVRPAGSREGTPPSCSFTATRGTAATGRTS